jgi:hypothetical protein
MGLLDYFLAVPDIRKERPALYLRATPSTYLHLIWPELSRMLKASSGVSIEEIRFDRRHIEGGKFIAPLDDIMKADADEIVLISLFLRMEEI